MSALAWLADRFADAVHEAGDQVLGLSGANLSAPIYSLAFLILFAAKAFGVLAWPWWTIFVPLVAAPLIQLLWRVAMLPVLFVGRILSAPLRRLLDWAIKRRTRRNFAGVRQRKR